MAPKKKFQRTRPQSEEEEDSTPGVLALPTRPKEPDTDLSHYTLLVYGREKIGKTTLFASFPEAVFFSTEPGTKGLRIFELNADDGGVRNWDIFRQGVDLLEANPGQFKNVIIDTVDRAYDMCLDWVCRTRGIEYPGTDANGKEDYGKSWRAVKEEFTDQIHRILQTGRGVCFSSHANEVDIRSRNGESYTRICPSMSGQARKVIEALVDLFFYAEYVRDIDGNTRRILICEGDETIWAGARATVTESFPRFLPLEKNGYKVIRDAFLGKHEGIAASEIMPGKATTETGKQYIRKARTEEGK